MSNHLLHVTRASMLGVAIGIGIIAFAGIPEASADTAPVAAQPAPSPRERLEATFVFVGGNKEIAAKDAAIDKATEGMFFVIRGLARSKLRARTAVGQRVAVAFVNGNISVQVAGEAAAVSPEDGGTVAYEASSGASMQLSQRLTPDGNLVQVFTNDNGARRVMLTPSRDGKVLTVFHEVSSSKLPQPVRYRLTYRRA